MPNQHNNQPLSRRHFLRSSALASAGLLLAACAEAAPPLAQSEPAPTATQSPPAAQSPTATSEAITQSPAAPTATLAPTPACDDGDDPTPAQTAGPFYTPDTPQRTSLLEAGMAGTRLLVTGRVLTTSCQPVANALLDFWQADDAGEYDNVGFKLRGHQFADAEGRYRLETIVPGVYPGRTRHIHVRVQGPETELLTTQLYFPDEPGNARDGIFNPALVMGMSAAEDGQAAAFDFVL